MIKYNIFIAAQVVIILISFVFLYFYSTILKPIFVIFHFFHI